MLDTISAFNPATLGQASDLRPSNTFSHQRRRATLRRFIDYYIANHG
jgi:hypothetical protein